MSLRDIFLIGFIFGSVPFILVRPWIGILMFSWISYMVPHKLAWGIAFDMPFAAVVAAATLLGLLFDKGDKSIPINSISVIWVIFIIHVSITTMFALHPGDAVEQWQQVVKIQLMAFVTIMLMKSREKLNALVWVIVLSIGFYGVKGGIFAIQTGMNYKVWGPGGFIQGNNELALALIIILPLIRYLQLNDARKWMRNLLGVAMGLIAVSIIASYSRGAFLAGSVMALALLSQTRKRGLVLLGVLLVIPVVLFLAPEQWTARMAGIQSFENDGSAMGRINAWGFAYNLAMDRPFVGGGFDSFTEVLFRTYAPDPADFHDSHSIYFGVLGEHGFVGLGLFLALGLVAFSTNGWIKRRTKDSEATHWAFDLASMIRVSLVGYAAGGAFLGLQYFDLVYHLIAITILLKLLVQREEALQYSRAIEPAAPPSSGRKPTTSLE